MTALRHLPNALTLARIALVLPLGWCLIERRNEAALVLALIAGFTDALDGFLAKRFGWESWLGGMLDPLADKLMLVVTFGLLAMHGELPAWLFGLVVVRDLVIIAGASAYYVLIGPVSAQPTMLSKLTTLLQVLLVLACLLRLAWDWSLPGLEAVLIWSAVAATVGSGLHYVWVWGRRARRARTGGTS